MKMSLKKLAGPIIALSVSATLTAQEKVGTSAQKTDNAVDKMHNAPSAVGRTVQGLGKDTSKPGPAQEETKFITGNPENPSPSEKKDGETPPPRISTGGKRDPFRPFTLNTRTSAPRRRGNLSPLERYELGQLKLVAVIWQVKEPSAMVEDGAGLGYLVKVGTPIGSNDGKVKTIQRDAIVIEEFSFDLQGAKQRHEVKMRLSPEKAE